jgi:hypothetical protein
MSRKRGKVNHAKARSHGGIGQEVQFTGTTLMQPPHPINKI